MADQYHHGNLKSKLLEEAGIVDLAVGTVLAEERKYCNQ